MKDKSYFVGFICEDCNTIGAIGYDKEDGGDFSGECPECGSLCTAWVDRPNTFVAGVDGYFHFRKDEGGISFRISKEYFRFQDSYTNQKE
jgi:hypothetical protein